MSTVPFLTQLDSGIISLYITFPPPVSKMGLSPELADSFYL